MASQSRFFKFFESARGRRFTFYSSVSAALGMFAVNFFPHTFLTTQHREFVANYKDGSERAVPDTLKKKFEIAQDYLKIIDFDRRSMKPFIVTGFDMYHLGSTKFRYGALVGIPINYTYAAASDIQKSDIIIRGNPVDWNSQGGKLLEESLVLAEDEQIFAIAREIIQLQNNNVYLKSFSGCGAFVMYYVITSNLNSKLRLFYRPLSFRAVLYTIVGLFVFGNYALLNDVCQVNYDKETDEKLAGLGKGFIEAGVRFYDKLLKKNMSCRELTGDESQYTALGNENFIVRTKRIPLTSRKNYFEQKLLDLSKEEKKTTGVTEDNQEER